MGGGKKSMSRNVDKRIVDMQFNNRQFERNVKTTMSTLKSLKASLKFDNAIKGFKALEKSASSVTLGGISRAIDKISDRFSTMGIIGATVISNLTNRAMQFGERLLGAVTIDPVKTGLEEYELKMNSIQTILTNTARHGTTLKDVNRALDDLNTYADKTIYNFAEMTNGIGMFVTSGLELDDATTSLKGLSNVAAGFGVDAVKMAGATRQVAQGLQSGAIKLQDWYSMESANMAGVTLQEAFRSTAEEMGVVIDRTKAFRDTLVDGWLTTDVFVETMKKMAADESLTKAAQNVTTFTKLLGVMAETMQSGWANTWEAILGDKNESTALWTGYLRHLGPL
jgi:tape measure domain-containing protein